MHEYVDRDLPFFDDTGRSARRREYSVYFIGPLAEIQARAQGHLARIEAEIAISTLLQRLPDLRLDDAEHPEWRPTFVLRGLKRLPASW